MTMVPQDAMMRGPDVDTISNRLAGHEKVENDANSPNARGQEVPPYGTPRLDITA